MSYGKHSVIEKKSLASDNDIIIFRIYTEDGVTIYTQSYHCTVQAYGLRGQFFGFEFTRPKIFTVGQRVLYIFLQLFHIPETVF